MDGGFWRRRSFFIPLSGLGLDRTRTGDRFHPACRGRSIQLSYKAVSPPAHNRRQADSQKERGMVVWPSPASNRKSRLDG